MFDEESVRGGSYPTSFEASAWVSSSFEDPEDDSDEDDEE